MYMYMYVYIYDDDEEDDDESHSWNGHANFQHPKHMDKEPSKFEINELCHLPILQSQTSLPNSIPPNSRVQGAGSLSGFLAIPCSTARDGSVGLGFRV